jgi:hypothetical protein
VYASRTLRCGEPIDYDGGTLWEAKDWDNACGGARSLAHLSAHTLDKGHFAAFG